MKREESPADREWGSSLLKVTMFFVGWFQNMSFTLFNKFLKPPMSDYSHFGTCKISWNVITSRQFPICFVQFVAVAPLPHIGFGFPRLPTPGKWRRCLFFFSGAEFPKTHLRLHNWLVVYYPPIWKICSSKWKFSSPIVGVKIKKHLSCHHPVT